MSKYIFTNKKICNVWLQATKNINWNVCLKIWGNKEMYQRKILSGIVAVQLVIFDCYMANLIYWRGGSFNHTSL